MVVKECLAIRYPILLPPGALIHPVVGPCPAPMAPLRERCERADHSLVSGIQPLWFMVIHRPGTVWSWLTFFFAPQGRGEWACGRREPGLSRVLGVFGNGVFKAVAAGGVAQPVISQLDGIVISQLYMHVCNLVLVSW